MARSASPFNDTPGEVSRGRGGFLRGANDTPYVADPDGATTKTGPRKGEPRRIPYGSPSNFGKLIENTHNLQKWGERRLALGVGADLTLVAACHALTLLDPDSDEFKTAADRIVVAAKTAAQASLAADRGTHTHIILEDDDEGRDWTLRADAGELLGIPADAQRALVEAWRTMLVRDGLQILASEASCVDDVWRLAGTLDNHARLGKDLRFRLVTGEIRTISAGTIVVLDKKTGRLRCDRNGVPQYWHGYVTQVASYAQAVPYDTVTEQRGVWPYTVDQDHALIAHLDVAGALDGEATCTLVYVDLVAGREHGGATIVAAKAWAARTDLLSVALIDTEGSAAPVRATVEQRVGGDDACPIVPPDTIDTPRRVIDEYFASMPTPPDEGADLSGPEYASAWVALEANFRRLQPGPKTWASALVKEALAGGVGFQTVGGLTARRFELYRGLILLADTFYDERLTLVESIEGLMALIAMARQGEPPTGDTPGHLLGSLNAAEASRFAHAVEQYIDGDLSGYFTDAGGFRISSRPTGQE